MRKFTIALVWLIACASPAAAQISGRVAEASRLALEDLRRAQLGIAPRVTPRRIVAPPPDLYDVSVKRLGKNLYLDTRSNVIIETQYCFRTALNEPALLKWQIDSRDELIFDEGLRMSLRDRCDVKRLR